MKLPKSPKAARNREKQLRKSADNMGKRAVVLEKRSKEKLKKSGCHTVTVCKRRKGKKADKPTVGKNLSSY